MKKKTYAYAYEACERFFTETGKMPTIETIKPIIGINSPSIISSAIKDWKVSLSQTIRKDNSVNPGIPACLMDTVTEFWQQAVAQANDVFNDKYNELQITRTELEIKEATLIEEMARIQQLVKFTEQKYQEEIIYLKKEIERLVNNSLTLNEQTENYRTCAIETEKKNAVLTEEIRQEKIKFHHLERQYDKEHDWAIKRIEEEKDRHRQQTHNEMLRLQSEVSRSKQALELLQAKYEIVTKDYDVSRDKIVELEKALYDEKIKMAGLALNEIKLKKALNSSEESIRSRLNKTKNKTTSQKNSLTALPYLMPIQYDFA
jgi:chromosome segregation ATPase